MAKIKPDDARVLRRHGERYSADKAFAVDFSDPGNPFRALTADEQKVADAEQAQFKADQKAAEEDAGALARERAGERGPGGTPPAAQTGA